MLKFGQISFKWEWLIYSRLYKFIGKSKEQILSKLNKSEILRLYSWVALDVTKNQTKKLSILLSFYFHEVLQYLNIFT